MQLRNFEHEEKTRTCITTKRRVLDVSISLTSLTIVNFAFTNLAMVNSFDLTPWYSELRTPDPDNMYCVYSNKTQAKKKNPACTQLES